MRSSPSSAVPPFHILPEVLNLVFFEASPDRKIQIADHTRARLLQIREARAKDINIQWIPEIPPQSPLPDSAVFYKPRIYTVSGTFDVAATFFSPSLDLAAWYPTDGLRYAGQDIHICFLPTSSTLGVSDAFNEDFMSRYEHLPSDELTPDETFFAAIKLKLNPTLSWPQRNPSVLPTRKPLLRILSAIAREIANWRGTTTVGPDAKLPAVALTLGSGWADSIVLAHADSPGKLLRLALRLRQLSAPSKVRGSRRRAHLVSTTITAIGADYHLYKKAHGEFSDYRAKHPKSTVPVEQILSTAVKIAGQYQPAPVGDMPGSFLQVGCHTYPGHEAAVLRCFDALEQAMRQVGILGRTGDGYRTTFEVGHRDLWAPMLLISESLSPRLAATLAALIEIWIRDNSLPHRKGHYLSVFDFFLRCGTNEPGLLSAQPTTIEPKNHITGTPGTVLVRENFVEDIAAFIAASVPEAMRRLQVPYTLSEQFLNVFNLYLWVTDREILWDEGIEWLPVILALVQNLDNHRRWWVDNPEVPPAFTSLGASLGTRDRRAEGRVRTVLQEYYLDEIPEFLHAFRASFYNRHLSSYLTEGMPDFNLRYRGSIHQLLSVANLLLDSFASVMFGSTACLAVIGDSTSPVVYSPCNVLIVKLSYGAFSTPILLESLAHEVGHEFLRNIYHEGAPERNSFPDTLLSPALNDDTPRGAVLRQLRDSLAILREDIFLDASPPSESNTSVFIEATSDLIELKLLGCKEVDEWVQSFLLRLVAVGLPLSKARRPSGTEERTPILDDVPYLDEEIALSGLLRAIIVSILLALAEKEGDEIGLSEFLEGVVSEDLANLRSIIISSCSLGPSRRAAAALGLVEEQQSWELYLWNEVFVRLPWLQDQAAFSKVRRFVALLFEYIDSFPGSEPRAQSAAAFLATSRHAFQVLRNRVLGSAFPALHIRHWMSRDERHSARERHLLSGSVGTPWRVVVQPLKAMTQLNADRQSGASPSLPEVNSLIFQRGALIPRSLGARQAWMEANSTFLSSLMTLVPAWRASILAEAEHRIPRS